MIDFKLFIVPDVDYLYNVLEDINASDIINDVTASINKLHGKPVPYYLSYAHPINSERNYIITCHNSDILKNDMALNANWRRLTDSINVNTNNGSLKRTGMYLLHSTIITVYARRD